MTLERDRADVLYNLEQAERCNDPVVMVRTAALRAALRAALAAPVGEGQRPGEELKEFGYLPGHYEAHCGVCHLRFYGAKRSVICHPCALDEAAQRRKNAAAPHLAEAAGEQSAAPPDLWDELERNGGLPGRQRPSQPCAPAAGPSAGDAIGESGSVPASASNPTVREDRTVAAAPAVGLQAEPVALWQAVRDFLAKWDSKHTNAPVDVREAVDAMRAAQERPAERAQVPRDDWTTKLRDCLALILPMARAYAFEHPVGRNKEFVGDAHDRLRAYDAATGATP